jgi:inorganic pyrophosphatase
MKIDHIPSNDGIINVIIETPKGFQNKFAYDAKMDGFKLKKILPLGMVFPFDFGFIPNTAGGDGDPLDILVITEAVLCQGTLVECRPVGLLKAKQEKKHKKYVRNDRIVAISTESILYAGIKKVTDLNESIIKQLMDFFINYNELENKKFKPLKWLSHKDAIQLIKESKP